MDDLTYYDRRVLLGELAKARETRDRARRQAEAADRRIQELSVTMRSCGVSDEEIRDALAGTLPV